MAHSGINISHTYPDFYNYYLTHHHATHQNKTPDEHHQMPFSHWDFANISFLRHAKQAHQQRNVPDADIRETRTAYYLDIELPGVGDKDSINIAWLSPRLLVVEGLIGRLEVEGNLNSVNDRGHPNGAHKNGDSDDQQSMKGAQEAVQPQSGNQPWHDVVTVSERRIGVYSRQFTFACDVANAALRAKLRDGLLSVVVPKVEHNLEFGGKLIID